MAVAVVVVMVGVAVAVVALALIPQLPLQTFISPLRSTQCKPPLYLDWNSYSLAEAAEPPLL